MYLLQQYFFAIPLLLHPKVFLFINNCNHLTLYIDQLSIKVQSKATILDEGRTAYFTATASGINMNNYNYQWKKSGSMNLPNKVVGVNGVVLVIPNLTESDEGQYYCIVTNEWGRSVKSNHLTLTVKGTHA